MASASLAQVHRARLASNGEEVAIKMQYPFLKIQSKWDLFILKHLTNLCSYLSKRFKNVDFDFERVKKINKYEAIRNESDLSEIKKILDPQNKIKLN